jgi:hypothetical protein
VGAGGAVTTGGAGGGGAGGATTTSSTSIPGGQSFSVTFDPVDVAPGEEHTKCIVKRVGNEAPVHVGLVHDVLSAASHHFIVYRTADTVEQPVPFDCKPFADLLHPDKGTPLFITQKHDDVLALPDGVGVTFAAGQMVRLEMHYLDVTAADTKAYATATFSTIPDASFQAEADFLFMGNVDVDLLPHASVTLGPTYAPMPAQLGEAKFFGITGHEHRFGTGVKVATAPGKEGPDTSVYDVPGWQWSEPETVLHDPPFTVPKGGGFRYSCSWNNTGDAEIKFGESANDEMCFFWAYYYPSQGALVCAHTDKLVPGGYDLCCPGNPYCSQILP